MNITKLTPNEKDRLFTLICYGRATPANVARLLGIDRRTAQRLTADENLPDLIPDPAKGDIARWYALLDREYHSWTTTDGAFHFEARTAAPVREDLAFLVKEIVGDKLKKRMIEECPTVWRGAHTQYRPVAELRDHLTYNFTIPDEITRHYRRATAPTFTGVDGRDI